MSTLKNYLLDIIFPRRCLGCDIKLGEEAPSYVCGHCLKTITFKNDFACAFCKSPVKNGKTCPYCVKDHFLDRLLVTTSYENPLVEKMLKTMKYRFVASLANKISDLMTRYLKKVEVTRLGLNFESPTVMPVPLHFKRLNWRGFNQAEIMAQGIGNFFGWPVATRILHRKNRKPQADMPDRTSRIQNAQNLFNIYGDRPDFIHHKVMTIKSSPDLSAQVQVTNRGSSIFVNKNREILDSRWNRDKTIDKAIDFSETTILLIDDISTTGSTLDDCARALKGAGAKEVIGFVFARNR